MEENAETRCHPGRSSNNELEKFKRRLIRAVARMLLHEKRNEEEVWTGLKKQTGCDCKELWSRMHALTMKKLDRLLSVQDEVQKLPKAARMSITDWLLFDTVLVHEEFDVIGITETTKEDKDILRELYELVEKFQIEFLAGDNLAQAWMEATLYYNKNNRQCTPMLLQRRWYQLKLATRARFYKFWSIYKGVEKRIPYGEPYKPTPLQTTIAKRYKPLVVKPFMVWEDLLKHKLIILPEDFERIAAEKQPKEVVEEGGPDIVCLEPEVETIDVEDNSDNELEYREEEETNVSMVKIKQEPIDYDEMETDATTPYENRQEKISHFAEAVMEATAMELDEIELSSDIDQFLDDKSTDKHDDALVINEDNTTVAIKTVTPNETENPSTEAITTEPEILNDDVIPVTIDDNDPVAIDDVIPVTTNDVIPVAIDDDVIAVSTDKNIPEGGEISIPNDDVIPVSTDDVINVSTDDVVAITTGDDEIPISTEENTIPAQNLVDTEGQGNQDDIETPDIVLPQITSIFGGVDVSGDSLSKLGLLTTDNAIIEGTTNIETDIDISKNNVDVEALHHEVDIKIEFDVGKNVWYNDLPNDIDFADDGIQLTEEEEMDDDYPKPIETVKTETNVEDTITKFAEPIIDEDEDSEEEEIPKVDPKLLLIPAVATVKLDDMGILPINLLEHIDNKALIDLICIKSKVVPKPKLKPEPDPEPELELNPEPEPEPEPETDPEPELGIEPKVMSDSSDEEIMQLPKRIKLSSALLQKPRSRTYNTIQVCKNPDFNTRLKRLNAGFFSSRRNLLLLKACEPVTIDVSKAFESRLVKGTMYLKASDEEELQQNIDLTENSQNVSVVPSAMVVQSLIDNTTGEVPVVTYSPKPEHQPQRNKTINLPDITEIRRINQNLLTAEVTPVQMKNNNPQVPVNVPSIDNSQKDSYSGKAGPACRTRQPSKVVDITDNRVNPVQTKNNEPPVLIKGKIPPWKIRYKAVVPWYSSTNRVYSPDTLLALDTLNKMLFLLTNGEIDVGSLPKNKTSKVVPKRGRPTKRKADDDDDDVQLVSETKLDKAEAKQCRRKKTKVTPKPVYCCWCREKICQAIFNKTFLSKHNCPYPLCLCCCKEALVNYYHKKRDGEKKLSIKDVPQPLGCINSALGFEDVGVLKERLLRQVPPQRPQKVPPPQVSIYENTDDVAEIIRIVNVDQPTSSNPAEVETTSETATIADNVVASCSEDSAPNETVCLDSEPVNDDDDAVCVDDEAVNVDHVAGNVNDEPANVDKESHNVEDEPINEPEPEMNDFSNDSTIVGAEVSVTTSESNVPDASHAITSRGVTRVTTATNTESLLPKKPLIRVKSKKKLNVTYLRKKNIYEDKVNVPIPPLRRMQISTQHIKVTTENDRKFVIIHPEKMVKTADGSIVPRENQKNCSLDTTKIIRSYSQKITQQRSSEPSADTPIFLGENKILLTTAKFPPNYKNFEEFQRNIKQTLALPDGLQLVLSPCGKITSKIHPNAQINDVFMELLPQLIESIQQHIDQGISTINRPVVTCPVVQSKTNVAQDDVINLSDDETPAVTENSENSLGDKILEDNQNETKQTIVDIPVVEQETVTSMNADDTSQNSDTKEMKAEQLASPAIDNEIEKTHANIENPDSIEIMSKHTESSGNVEDVTLKSDTTEVATQHTDTKTTNVEEGNENTNTNAVTTEIPETTPIKNTEATENDTTPITNSEAMENVLCSKPKNILSDLMAMSGIEDIDIALPQETPSTTVTQEAAPETLVTQSVKEPSLLQPQQKSPQDSSVQITHTSNDACVEQPVNKLTSLSPITAISELKYACEQKGLFFKLDFITGLLMPINVCMKKYTEAERASNPSHPKSRVRHCRTYISKISDKGRPSTIISSEPKPVIDLTDDDVCETVPPVEEVQGQELLKELNNGPKLVPIRPRPAIQVRSSRSLLLSPASLSDDGTSHYSIDLNHDEISTSNVQVQKAAQINTNIKLLRRIEQSNIPCTSKVQGVIEDSQIAKELKSFKIYRKANQPNNLKKSKLLDLQAVTKSCNEDTIVKPVALFKKAGKPNILRRKLKEIQQRIKDAMSVQDMIRRKLKRKQEFVPESNQLMTVSSDSESDELALGTNQLMSVLSNSDSDSDEEPLAKIATKMRESEKEAALKAVGGNATVDPSGECSTQVENVPEKGKISTADEADVDMLVESLEDLEELEDFQDDADPSMTEAIDMPIECLDEDLLQDDDTADDCILGV